MRTLRYRRFMKDKQKAPGVSDSEICERGILPLNVARTRESPALNNARKLHVAPCKSTELPLFEYYS